MEAWCGGGRWGLGWHLCFSVPSSLSFNPSRLAHWKRRGERKYLNYDHHQLVSHMLSLVEISRWWPYGMPQWVPPWPLLLSQRPSEWHPDSHVFGPNRYHIGALWRAERGMLGQNGGIFAKPNQNLITNLITVSTFPRNGILNQSIWNFLKTPCLPWRKLPLPKTIHSFNFLVSLSFCVEKPPIFCSSSESPSSCWVECCPVHESIHKAN